MLGLEGADCHPTCFIFCKLFQCTLMLTAWQIQQEQTIIKGQRCSAEVTNWTLCAPLLCIKIINRTGAEPSSHQECTRPSVENTAFPLATQGPDVLERSPILPQPQNLCHVAEKDMPIPCKWASWTLCHSWPNIKETSPKHKKKTFT